MSPSLTHSWDECGFYGATWDSLLFTLRAHLADPANLVGLEGIRKHKDKWNSWLEALMEHEVGLQFWRPEMRHRWVYPEDKRIPLISWRRILKFLGALIKILANQMKQRVRRGENGGGADTKDKGPANGGRSKDHGAGNDKNLTKNLTKYEYSAMKALGKQRMGTIPAKGKDFVNRRDKASGMEEPAGKIGLGKDGKEKVTGAQGKRLASAFSGPSQGAGSSVGEKRELVDDYHYDLSQFPSAGLKSSKKDSSKPSLGQKDAAAEPDPKHIKRPGEPKGQGNVGKFGPCTTIKDGSVGTMPLDKAPNPPLRLASTPEVEYPPPSFTPIHMRFICHTRITTSESSGSKHRLICAAESPSLSMFLSYVRSKHSLERNRKLLSLQAKVGSSKVGIDLSDPDKDLEWNIVLGIYNRQEEMMGVTLQAT